MPGASDVSSHVVRFNLDTLAQFEGNYRSEELGVTWSLAIRDSHLVLNRPGAGAVELKHPFAGTFTGAQFTLVFDHPREAKTHGFSVSAPGVSFLRFARVF